MNKNKIIGIFLIVIIVILFSLKMIVEKKELDEDTIRKYYFKEMSNNKYDEKKAQFLFNSKYDEEDDPYKFMAQHKMTPGSFIMNQFREGNKYKAIESKKGISLEITGEEYIKNNNFFIIYYSVKGRDSVEIRKSLNRTKRYIKQAIESSDLVNFYKENAFKFTETLLPYSFSLIEEEEMDYMKYVKVDVKKINKEEVKEIDGKYYIDTEFDFSEMNKNAEYYLSVISSNDFFRMKKYIENNENIMKNIFLRKITAMAPIIRSETMINFLKKEKEVDEDMERVMRRFKHQEYDFSLKRMI